MAKIYPFAFLTAAAAFCLRSLFAARLGGAAEVLAVIGNATCGWAWLATRSIFRDKADAQALWPALAVLLLMAISAAASLLPVDGMPLRVLDNLSRLGSSTVLLLTVTEPLRGLGAEQCPVERRFRIFYLAGYLAILAAAVLAIDSAPAGSPAALAASRVKVVCAVLAVAGLGLAMWYRAHHPLAHDPPRSPRKPIAADPDLAERLSRLVLDRQLYTKANLRVSDIARLAGEAEYKVTQCITGPLGFRNFNQMINGYRIQAAKLRLADPTFSHHPILTIALDCGFGSIGPFNRAFKADSGMTPLDYRRLHKTAS